MKITTPRYRRNLGYLTFSNDQHAKSALQISYKGNSGLKPKKTAKMTPLHFSPAKTQIFGTCESAAEFYDIKPILHHVKNAPHFDEIFFTEPIENTLVSSFIIVFISSYFNFLMDFTDICNDGEVSINKFMKNFKLFSNEIFNNANDMSTFVQTFQYLNVSLFGPAKANSYQDLQSSLQYKFESNHTEDIIFEYNINEPPKNQVTVKSANVYDLTEQNLNFEYKLRWIIAFKNDRYFPVILREDYCADVLYEHMGSHIFGSVSSLFYSGVQLKYVCYSLRKHDCPKIRIQN